MTFKSTLNSFLNAFKSVRQYVNERPWLKWLIKFIIESIRDYLMR